LSLNIHLFLLKIRHITKYWENWWHKVNHFFLILHDPYVEPYLNWLVDWSIDCFTCILIGSIEGKRKSHLRWKQWGTVTSAEVASSEMTLPEWRHPNRNRKWKGDHFSRFLTVFPAFFPVFPAGFFTNSSRF
jgi:hypothetical protein